MERALKPKNLALIVTCLAAIVLLVGLFVMKIGVSDNGSLHNVLKDLGLYDAQMSTGSGYYSDGFGVEGNDLAFKTSNLAYDIGKLGLAKDGVVPVSRPAIVYTIIFLIGLYLFISSVMGKYKWNNILLAVLALFMFADIGYISYFNTPYAEGAAFAYLILTVGLFVYTIKNENFVSLIFLGIAGFLFAGATIISAFAGIVLGLFALRLMAIRKDYLWRIISVIICLVITITGIITIARADNTSNMYNSVFYGAVENVSDIGLSKDLQQYVGVASHEKAAQEFINSKDYSSLFLKNMNYTKISMFYVKNMGTYIKNLGTVANNSNFIRTEYLGNYSVNSGKEPKELTGFFSIYSTLKPKVVPSQLYIILGLLIILIIGAFKFRNGYAKDVKDKILCEFAAVGALVAIFIFKMTLLIFGLAQIGFNLFLYNVVFDLCLFALIVGGTRLLWIRREKLKDTYGVNQ